jgi:hypothetical protein
MKPRVAADRLRNAIAECLHQVSANELAEICNNLGLEPGETGEAFKSKRVYVRRRLGRFDIDELIAFGHKVLTEYECRELEDLIAEATLYPGTRVSEITRRDVLKALNSLPTLFGDTDLYTGLCIITPESLRYDELARLSEMSPSLASDIDRHYVRNSDYSNEELLIKCGALTCVQSRVFCARRKTAGPRCTKGTGAVYAR